jgi:PAS domain S-box-containing protein
MQNRSITAEKPDELGLSDAEAVLAGIAEVFLQDASITGALPHKGGEELPNLDTKYRTLIEQLPAVVFMVSLDRGSGEAYVSPHIEEMLGFSQEEWLEDPIRWYERIHPDDKVRWSTEAAEMFLSGRPLRSVYRVVARDGRVIWFRCEAKMVGGGGGRPSFIHGVAFDVTDLKRAEAALQEERNFASALLDTVGALVVVLNREGRIVRFNRACERTTGYSFLEVDNRPIWDLFMDREEGTRFQTILNQLHSGQCPSSFESTWVTREGLERRIAWSSTILSDGAGAAEYVIATGIDVTESKHLEKAILDISGREQRRIGQDLHDGLGQHLTGIAFMSKVLEQKLAEKSLAESTEAAKIVKLVNEAIHKTRELSRGLLPVLSDARGLMSALEQLAVEVEDVFRVSCRFECHEAVLLEDDAVATHLYHIAQEAVHNAIKHGRARNIVIGLAELEERFVMTIEDDGVGFPENPAPTGMGLHIMSHRAKMVGGTLDVERRRTGGTLVACSFPCDDGESE